MVGLLRHFSLQFGYLVLKVSNRRRSLQSFDLMTLHLGLQTSDSLLQVTFAALHHRVLTIHLGLHICILFDLLREFGFITFLRC